MRINKLTLEGFRNYRGQTLEFDPACNVIHGENAQGKTNLLEAMVYLSCGKSPRTRTERELIDFDGGEARIIGEIYSREREFITDIILRAGSRRKMTVNGVAAKNASELSEVLHTVFFSPEDLFLIRQCIIHGITDNRRPTTKKSNQCVGNKNYDCAFDYP